MIDVKKPARSELAGLVIMEAMTAGLPVLLTDVCGYASHLQNAGAGVVLQSPFNQAELNAPMLEMLSAPQAHRGQAGVEYTQRILSQSSSTAEADLIIAFVLEEMKKLES